MKLTRKHKPVAHCACGRLDALTDGKCGVCKTQEAMKRYFEKKRRKSCA